MSVGDSNRRETYEALLRRHIAALRRVAWSYARNAFEDLFQEIAIALWKALPRFCGDSSERTWVYRVAHNTAISFMTSHRRRSKLEQAGGDMPELVSHANPEGKAIDREQHAWLWTAVQRLPLHLPMLWMAVEFWRHSPAAAVISLAVVTAAFAFIGWLNEKCAVRHLEEARNEVSATLEGEES